MKRFGAFLLIMFILIGITEMVRAQTTSRPDASSKREDLEQWVEAQFDKMIDPCTFFIRYSWWMSKLCGEVPFLDPVLEEGSSSNLIRYRIGRCLVEEDQSLRKVASVTFSTRIRGIDMDTEDIPQFMAIFYALTGGEISSEITEKEGMQYSAESEYADMFGYILVNDSPLVHVSYRNYGEYRLISKRLEGNAIEIRIEVVGAYL